MLQKTFEILYLLHFCLQRVLTLPFHISYHRRYCWWPDSLQLLVLIKTACIYVQYIRLTEGRIWRKNEWKRVYIFLHMEKNSHSPWIRFPTEDMNNPPQTSSPTRCPRTWGLSSCRPARLGFCSRACRPGRGALWAWSAGRWHLPYPGRLVLWDILYFI